MAIRNSIFHFIRSLMAAAALSGCSLMSDDLSECPTELYVNFVYDYNTQRADMLKDHVGAVTLSVYDEADRMVAQRTVSGGQLADYGFTIRFTEQDLAPGHTYRLMALATQKDWETQQLTPGAKYRTTGFALGNQRQDLAITLDSEPSTTGGYATVAATAPLDTLWHTLCTINNTTPLQPAATRYHLLSDGTVQTNGVETVTLTRGEATYVTVSLIRDTKHLNISLREIDHPERVNHEDYEVMIVDANTRLDYQNQLVSGQDTVVYRPYAQWTTAYDGEGTIGEQRAAHYDLMFNRLMYRERPADCAALCIRRKSDGQVIAMLNLPEVLSQGRIAYEVNNYSPQEYLDREYDYRLELFLKGDEWQRLVYLKVCIDVLSWARRIQYMDF